MSSRTVYLSRLFGLYCILVALSMMIRKATVIETVKALLNNSPLMFLLGVMTLIGGLAMVLAHNVWSGGAAPLVVTLIGWVTLAKGLVFLFLQPEQETALFLDTMQYERLFYVYLSVSLVIGIYLTYEGFRSRPRA